MNGIYVCDKDGKEFRISKEDIKSRKYRNRTWYIYGDAVGIDRTSNKLNQ